MIKKLIILIKEDEKNKDEVIKNLTEDEYKDDFEEGANEKEDDKTKPTKTTTSNKENKLKKL